MSRPWRPGRPFDLGELTDLDLGYVDPQWPADRGTPEGPAVAGDPETGGTTAAPDAPASDNGGKA